MDRVFEPMHPAVAVAGPITPQQETFSPEQQWRPNAVLGVVMASTVAISLAALVALLMWRQWMNARQELQQQRQLQLLERLQSLPPQKSAPQSEPAAPPAWTEPLPPIRVAIPDRLPAVAAPPPANVSEAPGREGDALSSATRPSELPELLGVVRVPGSEGSAIFSTASGSVSTAVGEAIGASGWRLQKVSSDQVEIERDGERQQLSLGGR